MSAHYRFPFTSLLEPELPITVTASAATDGPTCCPESKGFDCWTSDSVPVGTVTITEVMVVGCPLGSVVGIVDVIVVDVRAGLVWGPVPSFKDDDPGGSRMVEFPALLRPLFLVTPTPTPTATATITTKATTKAIIPFLERQNGVRR